ncbi:MAG: glutathione S-transferase family protein [Alphaproteobacteria bacterium]|nr:glutathione S-transferase family protein [Alphaproteobacteria bacterium]MDX5416919.1 glutathione S-transferase family protein [Alphaproteobacteria bacterium]MDX5494317.1 glutathione S-transferase family protein [Alphaproteobacteria bacterium]
MGLLVEGKWTDKWYDTKSTGGAFKRQESSFRNWVTADGGAGPTGDAGFKAEAGRYHLYVSLACPWAHRTLIFRKLKGLEDKISVSVVDPLMLDEGWTLKGADGATVPDFVNRKTRLYEIYLLADKDYTGRVTVPVLWDKQKRTIVTNESAEIIRMFNSAFDGLDGVKDDLDFYPEDLRGEIDAVNKAVYDHVNNGVYKAGFATEQSVYEKEATVLFEDLDRLEARLGTQRYLAGDRITEADWRLFTTLIRFDAVYHGHFKCNLRRIADYPNLANYMRELYQVPGVAETVNMDHIKQHYYGSHKTINPTGIVPAGPIEDFTAPHDRTRFG